MSYTSSGTTGGVFWFQSSHATPPPLAVDLDIGPNVHARDVLRAALEAGRILWPNHGDRSAAAIAPLFAAVAREAQARGAIAYLRLVRQHDRQRIESRAPAPPSEITVVPESISTAIDWPSRGPG